MQTTKKTKNIDKWIAVLEDDDIFICLVPMRETAKQLRYVKYEDDRKRNYAYGFNGTVKSHGWLLSFNIVFDKDDRRLFDTYEEARDSIIKQIQTRVETAKRQLEKAQALEDLFNSVPYVKR